MDAMHGTVLWWVFWEPMTQKMDWIRYFPAEEAFMPDESKISSFRKKIMAIY
jgi:hypothetical protein